MTMQEKLLNDKKLLEKQRFWVVYSYKKCKKIGIKDEYTPEEFSDFENLCARYSRGIDFLIRKIFRTLDEYEFENQGTLIDVVNNAHKRGLFEDVQILRVMKDIRNTIAHEYIEENLSEIFVDVLKYSENLLGIIDNTIGYVDRLKIQ